MGQKTIKSGHRASRAVLRPEKGSKKEVLDLYIRLKKKGEEKRRKDPFELLFECEPGGAKYEESFEPLDKLLDELKLSPDFETRYRAVRQIAKMRYVSAVDDLVSIIENDKSEKVKEGAVKALGILKVEEVFGYLIDILNDTWGRSVRVRRAAARAIGHLSPKEAAAVLTTALTSDPDMDVRREAAESLAICFLKLEKNLVASIAGTISSQVNVEMEPEHEVRLAVLNAITVADSAVSCVDRLITVLRHDPHPRVRGQAANTLAHFFDPRIEKALIESLEMEKDGLKKRIALAIAHYAMRNPLGLHDEVCEALIYIQKTFPRGSYIWKEAVKALPAV